MKQSLQGGADIRGEMQLRCEEGGVCGSSAGCVQGQACRGGLEAPGAFARDRRVCSSPGWFSGWDTALLSQMLALWLPLGSSESLLPFAKNPITQMSCVLLLAQPITQVRAFPIWDSSIVWSLLLCWSVLQDVLTKEKLVFTKGKKKSVWKSLLSFKLKQAFWAKCQNPYSGKKLQNQAPKIHLGVLKPLRSLTNGWVCLLLSGYQSRAVSSQLWAHRPKSHILKGAPGVPHSPRAPEAAASRAILNPMAPTIKPQYWIYRGS